MASEVTSHEPNSAEGPATSQQTSVSNSTTTVAFLALLVLSLLPLWWTYFSWTMRDGHYRHFPLLWIAVGFLYYQRIPVAKDGRTPPSAMLVGIGLFAVGSLILAGHILFSGFLGTIATVTALGVISYAWLGWGGTFVMLPVLFLASLAIPFPLNWDRKLIFEMQFFASQLASLLLDGAGIMHVREGVVLITEKSQFMTEEACSGVRSLFSSLTVVSVYAVASGHRLARLITNLIVTVPWVLIGNAIRIALCVFLADSFDTGWADGPKHEFLSFVIFGFILVMVLSSDRIISSFAQNQLKLNWADDLATSFGDEKDVAMNEKSSWWGRKEKVEMGDAGDDETMREQSWSLFRPFGAGAMGDEEMSEAGSFLFSRRGIISLVLIFAVLALLGGYFAIARRGTSPPMLAELPRLPDARKEYLPKTLAGWERVDYEAVTRDPNALYAINSFTWTYRKGRLSTVVSIDCPWDGWHDLNLCYTAIGWKSDVDFFQSSPPDVPYSDLTYSHLRLSKTDQRRGHVFFSSVDSNRSDLRKYDWRWSIQNLSQAFSNSFSGQGTDSAIAFPATTIQIFSNQRGDYTEHESQELQDFFFAVRGAILDSPRWASAKDVTRSGAGQ